MVSIFFNHSTHKASETSIQDDWISIPGDPWLWQNQLRASSEGHCKLVSPCITTRGQLYDAKLDCMAGARGTLANYEEILKADRKITTQMEPRSWVSHHTGAEGQCGWKGPMQRLISWKVVYQAETFPLIAGTIKWSANIGLKKHNLLLVGNTLLALLRSCMCARCSCRFFI